MADLSDLNFNAREVAPSVPMEPVPAGAYTALITESEWTETKDGTGRYLKLSLQIQGGPHDGRILFDRLNLFNRNDQAVEIARRTLSAVCHATGVMDPKDSSQFHNLPIGITVKVKPRNDQPGSFSNEISGYKPIKTATSGNTSNNGPPATAPWKR